MSGLYMLADALLGALSAKLERDVLLAKVRELEGKGATVDQITVAIRQMETEALQKAQQEIDRA